MSRDRPLSILNIIDTTVLSLREGDILWVRGDTEDLEELRMIRDVIMRQMVPGVRLVVTSGRLERPVILRMEESLATLDHPADDGA